MRRLTALISLTHIEESTSEDPLRAVIELE
jgi:hypothetical protein